MLKSEAEKLAENSSPMSKLVWKRQIWNCTLYG